MVEQTNIDTIWQWLDQVPDPEIPVVSVVDLGIVRAIAWQDDCLKVTVTPTYSGCPATEVISDDIEKALKAHGIANVQMDIKLSPAWSTDWLSEKGRRELKIYGIAPPLSADERKPDCPRCDSDHTKRISEFGSTPCKALYKCQECLEPFDYFKCH